ncbi:DNA replication initiation control protein YabA [Enterococcus sp. CSURQ0835]|uniref:DNA replication initiation control protein YabA n=1 Tax=Enterococcus sp. CSURQ0835 TaxID=2681394 RepID=UPI001359748A|nr:DNA replication initiation control protein YabA [Enterococcus sp. CSURQ0835]
MDKRSVYDGLNRLQAEMEDNLAELTEMKTTLLDLIEKNVTLEMENERLRERIAEMEPKPKKAAFTSESHSELSSSRQNLERLYEEGFHVCNVFFGSRRENDEPCAFCIDVIYRERDQKK